MTVVALITWLTTAAAGLYLLAIWLIEYDREFQSAAATRLPVPVISTHVLLAISGLVVWVLYLITDVRQLAITAALILVAVALLGLTMAIRWVAVYRAPAAAADHAQAPAAVPRNVISRCPSSSAMASSPSPRWSWSCSRPSASAEADRARGSGCVSTAAGQAHTGLFPAMPGTGPFPCHAPDRSGAVGPVVQAAALTMNAPAMPSCACPGTGHR